jgi:alkanesulfonate monooxygenase SsuD/methylene tetrahydromethanopterin reductase-like flavin-dependent oxidoreductase (luciferase family)
VWIAILRNEAAAQVGKRGFSPMMIPYATTERLDELAETVAAFRAAFAASGRDLAEATMPFGLHTYVGDSLEAATREAKEVMDRYVRTRLDARQRPYEPTSSPSPTSAASRTRGCCARWS